MEIDIGEQGRDNPALWCAAIGPLELPVVHAPGLEHCPDQTDEHRIIDSPGQKAKQDVMVDVVEEPADIHFDQPFHARPGFADLFESRVAGVTRAEPMTRSEEHTSELQSLMRSSYAVFCLKTKTDRIHLTKH